MIDEQMGAVYGGYITCRDDQIPEAKKLLLEQMIDMICAMATLDEFWIVTRLLNVDRPEGDVTVGYKISIPHMPQKSFYLDVTDNNVGNKTNADRLRATTDDRELAEMLVNLPLCRDRRERSECERKGIKCSECLYEWLIDLAEEP